MDNLIINNECNCVVFPGIVSLINSHVHAKHPTVTHVTVESYNTNEGNTVRLLDSFTGTVVGIVNLFKATII